MKLLDRLERRFGRYAVPNVTVSVIFCQVLLYLIQWTQPALMPDIALIPRLVMRGEVWRLISFMLNPPSAHPIFAFFFWYLLYLMGTALEATWGVFRYNVYLLVGYVVTVAVAFLQPDAAAPSGFIYGSVFLAFAWLYPDFKLLLFFLIPVKIKWLALLQWIGYFYTILFAPSWILRLVVLASICNFLVFFWHDILVRMRAGHRRMKAQAERIKQKNTPRHTCTICGVTNLVDPRMRFRYCSKCAGTLCYCERHIDDHEHVV